MISGVMAKKQDFKIIQKCNPMKTQAKFTLKKLSRKTLSVIVGGEAVNCNGSNIPNNENGDGGTNNGNGCGSIIGLPNSANE